jgi:hypothetical protein
MDGGIPMFLSWSSTDCNLPIWSEVLLSITHGKRIISHEENNKFLWSDSSKAWVDQNEWGSNGSYCQKRLELANNTNLD